MVDAGAGNDTIEGRDNQKIIAGSGNDIIYGGFSYLDAGDGDDYVTIPNDWQTYKVDHLDGGAGEDTLFLSSTYGATIFGSTKAGNVLVNFEKITFSSDGGTFEIGSQAGSAGETITIDASNSYSATFTDLSAANIIYKGAPGRYGGGGVDTVILGSGNDTINLDAGDDTITAGAGNDTIDGGTGTDIAIFSGNQSDYSITENSYDNYQIVDTRGIDGTDTISGIETLQFADSNYSIVLPGQNLTGTSSADTLTGGSAADLIQGLGGNDTLDGSDGNDTIQGGDGDDTLEGGPGDDTIYGGDGLSLIHI